VISDLQSGVSQAEDENFGFFRGLILAVAISGLAWAAIAMLLMD